MAGGDQKLLWKLLSIAAERHGKVITPLVAPDVAAGAPEARVTTVVPGGLSCSVESHQLRY